MAAKPSQRPSKASAKPAPAGSKVSDAKEPPTPATAAPTAWRPPHFWALGAVAAVYYAVLEWRFPSLAEFDAFYHVGLARLYVEHGFIREFPWMSMSVLRDRFNDPQLLMHLLMMPPLALGANATVTGKLLCVGMSVALALTFYWFLWRQKARLAFWWTLVWLGSSSYCIARLTFVKSTGLFLALTLVFLDALFELRTRRLFLVSALAVWCYQGFPLLGLGALLYLAARAFMREGGFRYETLGAILGGFLVGMIVNPFFPNDFHFFYFEIVQALFVKPQELSLGTEWAAIDSAEFLSQAFLPLGLLWLSEVVASLARPALDARQLFLRVTAFLLLVGALNSWRPLEYFAPFALIAAAITISRALEAKLPERLPWRPARGALVLSCVLAVAFNIKEGMSISKSATVDIAADSYRQVGEWLREHTDEKEVIVSQWDDFPMLFFNNPRNHYLYGLNIAYGYGFDMQLYVAHQLLFEARVRDPETFMDMVHSRWLVVARINRFPARQSLVKLLMENPRFEPAFSTEKMQVFKLKPPPATP